MRVYLAKGDALPAEAMPPLSPRKYWTLRGIAEWLVEKLAEDLPTLVGIDHGLSFPLRYFEVHGLKPDWPAFLDDFQRHWPTDDTFVNFVREGAAEVHSCRSPLAAAHPSAARAARTVLAVRRLAHPGLLIPIEAAHHNEMIAPAVTE